MNRTKTPWSLSTRLGCRSLLAMLVLVSGCTTVSQPPPHSVDVAAETMISSSASVSHTLVLDKDTSFVSCTAPPPDAVFSQGESAAMKVSYPGGPGEGGSESETSGESGLPGRTPALLIARELFFRACEFSRNYELSTEQAIELYERTLSLVGAGWAKEAENTLIKVGETQLVSGSTEPALPTPNLDLEQDGEPESEDFSYTGN